MSCDVTVVIPCFNAARYIREAIASALNQTNPPARIVVVDDASQDDSAAIAAGFGPRVRVIRLETNSGGCIVPKDVGLRAAETEFVAFLDADDVWLPHKLERQMPLFTQDSVGLVYGRARDFDENGVSSAPAWPDELPIGDVTEAFYLRCFAPNSTVVARRTILLEAGGFDRGLLFCEDYDLWLRTAFRCKVDAVPDVVMLYRRHAGQISKRRLIQARAHIAVERRHLMEVARLTGIPVVQLKAGTLRRMLGQVESEFYHERNLSLARELADLAFELFPDLDDDTRRTLTRIRRRSLWPRFLFTIRDSLPFR